MAGDYLLTLEGVKGESRSHALGKPTRLALLVAELRQRCGGYVLTAVSHAAGIDQFELQFAMQEMNSLGIVKWPAPGHLAAPGGAGFIVVQAHRGNARGAQPMPVLLVIADQRDAIPLLLPAVQHLREAARRLPPSLPLDLVLVQRPSGPGAALATDQMAYNFTQIRMD